MDDKARQELKRLIDYPAEFSILSGAGTRRNCFNKKAHPRGDMNASLSFNAKTGAWKCHSCGIKGDVFTFHQMYYNTSFAATFKKLCVKYGVTYSSSYSGFGSDVHEKVAASAANSAGYLLSPEGAVQLGFLLNKYKLTRETVRDYMIGYDKGTKMYTIPVMTGPTSARRIINIRSHDCARNRCGWKKGEVYTEARPDEITMEDLVANNYHGWKPVWKHGGKTLNIKGHGDAAIYNGSILQTTNTVYVLGGELKVLMFMGAGLPAVCATNGEGGFPQNLIGYFADKTVRVLFDADPEKEKDQNGLNLIDRHSKRVASLIAEVAAHVEWGYWPDKVRSILPRGGDVNDLAVLLDLDRAGIRKIPEMIEWRKAERIVVDNEIQLDESPDFDDVPLYTYRDIVNPTSVGRIVSTTGTVSATGDHYLVPGTVHAECSYGQMNNLKKCADCALSRHGFSMTHSIGPSDILRMMGKPEEVVSSAIRKATGIAQKCDAPKIDITHRRVLSTSFVPEVERTEGTIEAVIVDDASYESTVTGGSSLDILGVVTPSPTSGKQVLVVTKRRSHDRSCFSYDPNYLEESSPILESKEQVDQEMKKWVRQIRESYLFDFVGVDEMIKVQMISFFMPFELRLGDSKNDRICPTVYILGDTTTGKTSIAMRLMELFGGMGIVLTDQKPTFAGLIGGLDTNVKPPRYTLGLIPLHNNRGLILDEVAELDNTIMQSMGSWFSSGVASRVVVGVVNTAQARNRMLLLSNPRRNLATNRVPRLSKDPIMALGMANDVFPSPQLFGRMDLVMIQHQILYEGIERKRIDHGISPEFCKNMLGFAWTRTPNDYVFDDPKYVTRAASDLAKMFGGDFLLLLPVQARWKIAKICAAVATMLRQHDSNGKIRITNGIVDHVVGFIADLYRKQFLPDGMIASDAVADIRNARKEGKDVKVMLDNMAPKVNLMSGIQTQVQAIIIEACRSEYDGRTLNRLQSRLGKLTLPGAILTIDDFSVIFGRSGGDVLAELFRAGIVSKNRSGYFVHEKFIDGLTEIAALAMNEVSKKQEKPAASRGRKNEFKRDGF